VRTRGSIPSLSDVLGRELAAFDGSEELRLQAVGQLRAETWIAVLSVIVETEGPAQAAQSLEALVQADTLLVMLALGWTPDPIASRARSH